MEEIVKIFGQTIGACYPWRMLLYHSKQSVVYITVQRIGSKQSCSGAGPGSQKSSIIEQWTKNQVEKEARLNVVYSVWQEYVNMRWE